MAFAVIGRPLERPPVQFQSLEFLTQPSPVEPDDVAVRIVADEDKDYQIAMLKTEVMMLRSDNERMRRVIQDISDPSGVSETLPRNKAK